MNERPVVFLYTTFPKQSETFCQREVKALQKTDANFALFSLHKGGASFEGQPIDRFKKWELVQLLWQIPRLFIVHRKSITPILRKMLRKKPPYPLNFWENLLGLAFACVRYPKLRRLNPSHIHAAWATTPAAAAMLLADLLKVPYSTGAHAYDVFQGGGDWLLEEKVMRAKFVHCSNNCAAENLSVFKKQLQVIRRGFDQLPLFKPAKPEPDQPLRILSVGRFVAKKGYEKQLAMYRMLRDNGVAFTATIIGGGPTLDSFRAAVKKNGLANHVKLPGWLDYKSITNAYEDHHALLFTGVITSDGDRDGLPNVLPEAMAHGLLVLASNVADVPAAISNGETGYLLNVDQPDQWVHQLVDFHANAEGYESILMNARNWVEKNYDANKNACILWRLIQEE